MIIKFREGTQWYLTSATSVDGWEDGTEVKLDDPLVTIDALVDCWQSDLEGANHHSEMDTPPNLVNVLRFIGCTENQVKAALWEILTTQHGWIQ